MTSVDTQIRRRIWVSTEARNVAGFCPPNLIFSNNLRSANLVLGSGGRGFESRRPDCGRESPATVSRFRAFVVSVGGSSTSTPALGPTEKCLT